MGEDKQVRGSQISGALIGWERHGARHGVVLTLQIVENAAQFQNHRYHRATVALNDRQLRSLARDLARAARTRGLDLRARSSMTKRMWQGLKSLIASKRH